MCRRKTFCSKPAPNAGAGITAHRAAGSSSSRIRPGSTDRASSMLVRVVRRRAAIRSSRRRSSSSTALFSSTSARSASGLRRVR